MTQPATTQVVTQDPVSMDQVRRVAELASLQLTEAELPLMQRDLNNILAYVDQLRAIDTTGIEPMAQIADLLPALAPLNHGESLRPDAIRPSPSRARRHDRSPRNRRPLLQSPQSHRPLTATLFVIPEGNLHLLVP